MNPLVAVRRPSNQTTLLVGANILALGFLAFVKLSAPADAQAARARGTYAAVAGRIPGTENHALYIVDEASQEAIAVQWDERSKQIVGLGYRSIAADQNAILRPRSN